MSSTSQLLDVTLDRLLAVIQLFLDGSPKALGAARLEIFGDNPLGGRIFELRQAVAQLESRPKQRRGKPT